MTEPLITLPSFVTIVAPWESGKTTLVKYLIYEHVEEICGIVVFSNSADNTYEKDYQFVHKRFTWDHFKEDFIKQNLMEVASYVYPDSQKHLILLFDDVIGMGSGFFERDEVKQLIITLRKKGVSFFLSQHILQKEVTSLQRQNTRDLFLFNFSEPNGLKIAYNNWGKPSRNLNDEAEFNHTVMNLEKHQYLHYNKPTQMCIKGKAPLVPPFRLYMIPEDKIEAEKKGLLLLYGNCTKDGTNEYDLSTLMRPEEEIAEKEKARAPRYREKTAEEREKDLMNDPIAEGLLEDIPVDSVTGKRKISEESDEEEEIEEIDRDPTEPDVEEIREPPQKKRKQSSPEPEVVDIHDPTPAEQKKKQKELDETETKELEEKINQIEKSYETEQDPVKQILAFRAKMGLWWCNRTPELKQTIELSFPDFFKDNNYENMELEDLLKKNRLVDNSFKTASAINTCNNQYKIVSQGARFIAEHVIGYKGPGVEYFDTMYRSQIAQDTLSAIRRINPLRPNKISPYDRIMNMIVPAAEMLLTMKSAVDFKGELNAAASRVVPSETLKRYEDMLPK